MQNYLELERIFLGRASFISEELPSFPASLGEAPLLRVVFCTLAATMGTSNAVARAALVRFRRIKKKDGSSLVVVVDDFCPAGLPPGGSAPPLKRPRRPLKGPRGILKGSRGPLKGPRDPFKGPRGPLEGPLGPSKDPGVSVKDPGAL